MDLLPSPGGFRTEIDKPGPQAFPADPLFFHQFQQRIVSAHGQQGAEFLVRHSLGALVDKEVHRIFQSPMLGEASRLPNPKASGIKIRDLLENDRGVRSDY